MNVIKFLGASGTVTGSSYFLSQQHRKGVLIDFGMYQGTRAIQDLNLQPLDIDFSQLNGVILTHAHLDHCGRLPLLFKGGYRGKIYMTKATQKLAELVMLDAAKIAKLETVGFPIYTESDVKETMNMIKVVQYHKEFNIGDYSFNMVDAGHLLGSASIIAKDGQETVVFSGDLGNYPQDILKTTEFIDQADVVVMESTYGDRDHGDDDPVEVLLKEINWIERTGGTLLIPSFALERTQELLHRINHLKQNNQVKHKTPVYVDGPMALKATRIYKQFRNLFNEHSLEHAREQDLFDFPGLVMVDNNKQSLGIKEDLGPKVIIAGSGMMSGGRILRHAKEFLGDKDTRLFIVGYQGEETLGREILQGKREVIINDTPVSINATVDHTESMSSHAGQAQLMKWLAHMKGVKQVYLTHGEDKPRAVLQQKIKDDLHIESVHTPLLNQQFDLM